MEMKMEKRSGIALIASLFTALFFSGLFIVSDEKETYCQEKRDAIEATENADDLEVIIIDNPVYEKDRKGPSRFEHMKHARDFGITCWECHHDYKNGENVWSPWGETRKCAECHDASEKIGKVERLQAAYHLKCKKCHEERKIFGEGRLVYRKCVVCHEAK